MLLLVTAVRSHISLRLPNPCKDELAMTGAKAYRLSSSHACTAKGSSVILNDHFGVEWSMGCERVVLVCLFDQRENELS